MSIFPERWMGRGVPTDKLPKYYTIEGKTYNTRTNEEVPKKKKKHDTKKQNKVFYKGSRFSKSI